MSNTLLNTTYHTEDNKLIIKRSQDVQRILDFNKERNIDGHNRNSDLRLAGSIPLVVAEMCCDVICGKAKVRLWMQGEISGALRMYWSALVEKLYWVIQSVSLW